MRFELTHRCRHYPLKVACLPIPPPAHIEGVPRTGLEPACLSTHAPETCASTNSATWAYFNFFFKAIASRSSYILCQGESPYPGFAATKKEEKPPLHRERKTELESATPTLARLCSTPELLPQNNLPGGGTQNRTGDTRIFSPLLYHLSYPALSCIKKYF